MLQCDCDGLAVFFLQEVECNYLLEQTAHQTVTFWSLRGIGEVCKDLQLTTIISSAY